MPDRRTAGELAETVREGLVDGNEWSCGCDDPGNPSRCIHVERFNALAELVARAEAAAVLAQRYRDALEPLIEAALRGMPTALAGPHPNLIALHNTAIAARAALTAGDKT